METAIISQIGWADSVQKLVKRRCSVWEQAEHDEGGERPYQRNPEVSTVVDWRMETQV